VCSGSSTVSLCGPRSPPDVSEPAAPVHRRHSLRGRSMTAIRRRAPYVWRTATIAALAAGQTVDQAAEAGQVSGRTVDRWSADAAFRAAVQKARERLLEKALGRAADLAVEAIEVLGEVMRDPTAAPAARVSAARALYEGALRGRELTELALRIGELEDQFRARSGDSDPAGRLPLRSAYR